MPANHDFSYFRKLTDKGITHFVFDADNTITRSTILELHFYIKKTELPKWIYLIWKFFFKIFALPFLFVLDIIDRALCQLVIYRLYRKYDAEQIERQSEELFDFVLKGRFNRYVHDLIFHLKSNKGVRVSILSSNIAPILKPYSDYFKIPAIGIPLELIGKGRLSYGYLSEFKRNGIKKFPKEITVGIVDSKHDKCVMDHCVHSVIVTEKIKPWMHRFTKHYILNESYFKKPSKENTAK